MDITEIIEALTVIKTELDAGLADEISDRQSLCEDASDDLLLLIEELSK